MDTINKIRRQATVWQTMFTNCLSDKGTSLVSQMVKHLPAMWEAWIALHYSFYGEGSGNPLQYSCLENSMDGGAW